MTKQLEILFLYERDMNIYGDTGNILALKKRAAQHGFSPVVRSYNPEDNFDDYHPDIIVGGGGQDSGQEKIIDDLMQLGQKLKQLADQDTPMLMICGMYQLFGEYFQTIGGKKIPGIGVFDAYTIGKKTRLIGNIVTKSSEFGEIIGYENHSGQTFLGRKQKSLGRVIMGAGNNEEDGSEGAIYSNVIGTYLHGSLLPKNPAITDFLIKQAALKKFGEFTPAKIDDSLVEKARQIAKHRPR